MRVNRLAALGVALAAGAFSTCASLPAEEGPKAERVCIKRREINTIRPLGDYHLFAKLSASRYYLLTVEDSCRGLRLARTVTIWDSQTRVCGDGTSLVSFEYPGVGETRCRIQQIEPVADQDAAWALIESETPPE
jgi:hypothetical protein